MRKKRLMRKLIAAGNWKMNTTIGEANELIDGLMKGERDENVITIIAPPFVYLHSCKKTLKETSIKVAAQNVSEYEKGAYTGEISANMLESMNIEFCIIGHSERREYQSETNEIIKQKVNVLLSKGITPIFCCGESLDIRKNNTHLEFVNSQISESLFHLESNDLKKIIIAYEPIWAIGTGETASPEQAQEMHANIRSHIESKYGGEISENISILYGGSVKPNNATDIFGQEDVDGGLVGGASLLSNSFLQIINSF